MNYVDQEDFLQEFGADDAPEDSSRIDRAIDRAESLVETYLRAAGMAIPVQDQGAIRDIKGPTLDIARYLLWNDKPSETQRERYEDALKFLESIASGKIKLIVKDPAPSTGFANFRIVRA